MCDNLCFRSFLLVHILHSGANIKTRIIRSVSPPRVLASTESKRRDVARVSKAGEIVDCVGGYSGKREDLIVHGCARHEDE